MNKRKKYLVPTAIAVAMEPTVILAGSDGDEKFKVTGRQNTDPILEYGGEAGGSDYDPD